MCKDGYTNLQNQLFTIRKVILHIVDEFPNNQSWRFVDSNYEFPNLNNPFAEPFPESIDLNNLANNNMDLDFVGIKIGDL